MSPRSSLFLLLLALAAGSARGDLTTNCGPDDPVPPTRVDTTERLADLRAEMESELEPLAAYLVPLDLEGRREWISGFSGSYGDAVVTADQAACWTDGRYFLQAADQLDCNWQLMREGVPGVPTITEWLGVGGGANLSPGSKVGADPTLIGAKTWLDMEAELAAAGEIELVSVDDNLIDRIWTEEEDGREPFVAADVIVMPLEYAGQSCEDKLAQLREELSGDDGDESSYLAMVVSELDEIAWLFNLRGEGDDASIASPLFESLALVTTDGEAFIWLHTQGLTQEVQDHLDACGVQIGDFDDALSDLSDWGSSLSDPGLVLLTNPSVFLAGASYALYEALPEERVAFADSPVLYDKSIKNQAEVAGMTSSHLRDAYACCKFFAEIEDDIVNNGAVDWTELRASERLSELRLEQDLSRGDSFGTIAASGSNGAVIHYLPTETTDASVNDSAVFLVDSGGLYLDGGTTDVTRTWFYGPEPTPELVDRYTRVLMGAVDLARAVFPDGTLVTAVDYQARQHLFAIGLDYNHNTGHGIGSYLSIHEGPISLRMAYEGEIQAAEIRENMFFSDEPGYYKAGEYGIRLETIVRVVRKEFEDNPEERGFLTLDPVTLVPFEPKLIDFGMMTDAQIQWYNEYNARILEEVVPYFEEQQDVLTLDWIYSKTQQVSVESPADPSNDDSGATGSMTGLGLLLPSLVMTIGFS